MGTQEGPNYEMIIVITERVEFDTLTDSTSSKSGDQISY